MFDDDKIKKTGNIPNNLPMGEPEDILSPTEKPEKPEISINQDVKNTEFAQGESVLDGEKNSALDAGILKPKQSTQGGSVLVGEETVDVNNKKQIDPNNPFNDFSDTNIPNKYMNNNDVYKIKEPIGSKKGLVWLIMIVVLVVLGLGSVWIYFGFIKNNPENNDGFLIEENVEEVEEVENNIIPDQEENIIEEETDIDVEEKLSDEEKEENLDDNIIVGQPIDTDNDGLDDVREYDLGTDPLNWDTDLDELSDGDEIIIWKTDPLNFDSDGDTYGDGAEIKNGYNPLGTGRLFEIE